MINATVPPSQDVNADAIAELVKGLKNEIQALRSKCDALDRTIQDLKSKHSTHEWHLERHRQEIIGLKDAQGTLDTNFRGESFDLVPL